MSSHHIVREKQEPALYIHHLGAFDEEYLGQLLEWSPTLIVNAASFEKVISLGLKVDIAVNPELSHSFQENTKVITTDTNDMESVLQYLIAEKYPAVNVIDTDGNFDMQPYRDQINIVAFTVSQKAYAVKSGFRVWKPAGILFRIREDSFEYTNLEVLGKHEYRVIQDGFVAFTFDFPYLTISETL